MSVRSSTRSLRTLAGNKNLFSSANELRIKVYALVAAAKRGASAKNTQAPVCCNGARKDDERPARATCGARRGATQSDFPKR
jgi:hypothetical protein